MLKKDLESRKNVIFMFSAACLGEIGTTLAMWSVRFPRIRLAWRVFQHPARVRKGALVRIYGSYCLEPSPCGQVRDAMAPGVAEGFMAGYDLPANGTHDTKKKGH